MPNLTKIEKPYLFCTMEEQKGLDALIGIEDALQFLEISTGKWCNLPPDALRSASFGLTYRQNPDWQPPKLDVPDWLWENTDHNYVAMDHGGQVYAYKYKPKKVQKSWEEIGTGLFRLDKFFIHHDFNPHNIPWDQSLTKRLRSIKR